MSVRKRRLWREKLETVLEADTFDLWDWFRAIERVPQLDQMNKRAAREFAGQPAQDAFLSLYQEEPELAQNPPMSARPLASLLKRAMETPEWQALHTDATGDLLTCAFGAKSLVDNVFRNLPEEIKERAKEHKRKSEALAQAQREAQDVQDQADFLNSLAAGAGEGEGQPGDQTPGGADGQADAGQADDQADAGQADDQADAGQADARAKAMQDWIDQLQAEAEAAQAGVEEMTQSLEAGMEEFDGSVQQFDARIKAAFNEAAEDAQEEATEMVGFIKAFSEASGGDAENVSPEVAEMAMRALQGNQNLKDLADKLGWAQRVVNAERRKSPYGGTDLIGMTFGPLDLSRLAGQELVALAADEDNPLRVDALKRMLDSALLHREYEGEDDEQGKGTMILIRDESGSMRGQPHAMAVAVEWALLEAARKDNRRFFCIPFSGYGQYEVWEAPDQNGPDPEGLLEHLSHFYNGGTEPYAPLEAALDLILTDDLKADILILTDGSFRSADQEFLDKVAAIKERVPLNMEAVMIGPYAGNAVDWADKVHFVNDLVDDRETLRVAFQGVI